jgi:hypothetical protein
MEEKYFLQFKSYFQINFQTKKKKEETLIRFHIFFLKKYQQKKLWKKSIFYNLKVIFKLIFRQKKKKTKLADQTL